MNKSLANKILDILNRLSIDFDQTDNYDNQWRGQRGDKKFYLDVVYYDGHEMRIEDVRDKIMEAIKNDPI
ncbi:hypothetical protein KAX02_05485 [candidate division WOR-3 bacterium]|nr:hypothetical protein [candidate division WOR-3 bacterium]